MSSLVDPNDISPLLFQKQSTVASSTSFQPFLGPVRLAKVKHGRGLVATRDIKAGECLFVIQPTVSAPVEDVHAKWSETESVEMAAEEVLVAAMRTALAGDNVAVANSFLALVGSSDTAASQQDCLSVDRLLGKDNDDSDFTVDSPISNADLLQIVRRNAFGPDFVTYSVIERRWKADPSFQPSRILGLYPFAAMINHSCAPNALRVFAANNLMIVHASEAISAGQEILWSYLPPTLPYTERQSTLMELHGFVCDCHRCSCEKKVWESEEWSTPLEKCIRLSRQQSQNGVDVEIYTARALAVKSLEDGILVDKALSNETKRFLRIGFTNLYIQYLNEAVNNVTTESLLAVCMQLHFSFCSCDNASTEHLSVRSQSRLELRLQYNNCILTTLFLLLDSPSLL